MDGFEHEISDFRTTFPDCPFDIIEKIGQVYKARDVKHDEYDNSEWCIHHKKGPECGYVALKRIYSSSSPARIYSELGLLHKVSQHPNIAPLITAMRHEDQVVIVLPFFEHDSFKSFYKKLDMSQIKIYMRCLLSALECVHEAGYIHRDIKPSNFLYKVNARNGVLIDFGLAQPQQKKPENKYRHTKHTHTKVKKPGYLLNDTRPSIRASRAGTRGFRAPEVLFKVVYQTSALDIWSAGVILLSFLTGQFPFFQSEDDIEALLEIAHIFGKEEMVRIAQVFSILYSLDRTFETNLPSIGKKLSFGMIIRKLRPEMEDLVDEHTILFLEGLLELDPDKRFTAKMALAHPFLAQSEE